MAFSKLMEVEISVALEISAALEKEKLRQSKGNKNNKEYILFICMPKKLVKINALIKNLHGKNIFTNSESQ